MWSLKNLLSTGWLKPALTRPVLFSILLALATAKLSLVSHHEIIASDSPHDALWQILAAARGYWGRPFDEWTLMHLPVYPLYIAAVWVTGIPLRIAIELTYLVTAFVLAISLGRLQIPRLLQIAAFALIAFHPHSYEVFDLALAETLFACLMVLFVALFIYAITSKSELETWNYAAAFSITAALLWFCRKESALIGGAIAMIAITIIALRFSKRIDRGSARKYFGSLVVLPIVVIAVMGTAICAANWTTYGVWRTDILRGGNLARAYKALIRIDGGRSQRTILVNHRARELAYGASPAFAELRPVLEQRNSFWEIGTKQETGLDDEIAAGWFHWALIYAAARQGHFTSATEAERYFGRVADEIEAALGGGRLPRRGIFTAYLSEWPTAFPHSLLRVLQSLKPILVPLSVPPNTSIAVKSAFDSVANRRTAISMPPAPGRFVNRIRGSVDAVYLIAFAALYLAAFIVMLWRRPPPYCASGAALFFILILIGSRVAFFALVDAAAWNGAQFRYLFPIETLIALVPVLALGLALTGATTKDDS